VRFSVVIPLYNKRDHIERAIQSVLAQNEAFDELIVVDDGSADGGGELATGFGGKVRVIRQDNGGEAAARNRGISEAQGTHIAFLDADDRWLPDFLATIRRVIARRPGAAIYGTGYDLAEPDGSLQPGLRRVTRFVSRDSNLDYAAALASWCFALTSSSSCVPSERFREVGVFDESLALGTDIDMWVRLYLAGGVAFDPSPCAVYHRDAMNRSNRQPAFWDNRLQFLDAVEAQLRRDGLKPSDRANLRRFLARATYETLVGKASGEPQFDLATAMEERSAILGPKYRWRARARAWKRRLAGNA